MNRRWPVLSLALLVLGAAVWRIGAQPASDGPRFIAIDITADPHGQALAAYQFELLAEGAKVQIVGVEGGEHAAFAQPPYYDPAALSQNRIIIAALSTNTPQALPSGKTRIARLHLHIDGGNPSFRTHADVAAMTDGTPITAEFQVSEGKNP